MSTPLVTVIIPCFNYGKYLHRSVNSVLQQTMTDLEVIIVDDASTDNTPEIAESFVDSRVRYIRQPTNVGQSKNRNTGINEANGEFVALLDADDWLDPQYLETCLPSFSDPEVGCSYTSKMMWNDQTGVSEGTNGKCVDGWISGELFQANFIGTSVMFRKSAIPPWGYKEDLSPQFNNLGVDWWILLEISSNWKFASHCEPLYNYNIHEGQISSNLDRRILADRIIQNLYQTTYPQTLTEESIRQSEYERCIRESLYLRTLKRKKEAVISSLKVILLNPFCQYPYKLFIKTLIWT